jgi:vacuolar protein sorting-associated protein 13D
MSSLNVLNLLPNDVEFKFNKSTHTLQAGQRFQTASVNLDQELSFSLSTEHFRSIYPTIIQRKNLYERADGSEANRILIKLYDLDDRELHVYASVSVIRGGALSITLWVPFWLINRSGIPLIVKQDSAFKEAAGQVVDHEKAKDRNPLMFAFVEEGCPYQLMARVGKKMISEPGFKPQFSRPFSLAPGIQSLKLLLTHNQDATR